MSYYYNNNPMAVQGMNFITPQQMAYQQQMYQYQQMMPNTNQAPIIPPSPIDENTSFGIRYSFFNSENKNSNEIVPDEVLDEATAPKKRGRPKKKKPEDETSPTVVESSPAPLSPAQSNAPYMDQYNETNGYLRGIISQLDVLNMEVLNQLAIVKDSKTLKNKYNYIPNLAEVASGIINNKISAIKEINKTINDSNTMELRRIKELNLNRETNDDQLLMNMYNAYINTPVGSYTPPLMPTASDLNLGSGAIAMLPADVTADPTGYAEYTTNRTPEQNRMINASNPNIKTVVVYDVSTGAKAFQIIDESTGQPVPNMPLPDPFLLDDTTIDLRHKRARNANINADYGLIVVGDNPVNQY